jgi:hypothetical protein
MDTVDLTTSMNKHHTDCRRLGRMVRNGCLGKNFALLDSLLGQVLRFGIDLRFRNLICALANIALAQSVLRQRIKR